MVARFMSAAVYGIDGRLVEIEVDLGDSKNSCFFMSGLPGKGIRESRERIRSAIENSSFEFPFGKILVNLAPAAWEKEGTVFDLPIALGILVVTGILPVTTASEWGVIGELSLDGDTRSVPGVMGLVAALRKGGYERVLVPAADLPEASAVPDVECVGVRSLYHAVQVLRGDEVGETAKPIDAVPLAIGGAPNFREVRGHESIKRALEIAIAGGHNLLMVGPPGSGKSLIARRVPGLLPELSREEVLEVTQIHSAAGLKTEPGLIRERPFRAPHHTVSWAGLVGGGQVPRPGEITAAHRGVLFLDELPEYPRAALEALREPLEEGEITVSRSQASLRFPARFLLVAAMNPCPCGYYLHPKRRCGCSPERVRRYLERVSGPLLDRIDVRLEVQSPSSSLLLRDSTGGDRSTEEMAEVVQRTIRFARTRGQSGLNRQLQWAHREQWAPLTKGARQFLERAAEEMDLSTRGLTRVLRLARTVADAEETNTISDRHLYTALDLRCPRNGEGMLELLGS